jgi:hypothetical protein
MTARQFPSVVLAGLLLLSEALAAGEVQTGTPRREGETESGRSAASGTSIEIEDLTGAARTSAGQVVRQEMQGFGPGWSGGQLFWRAPAPADTPIRNWPNLRLPFAVPSTGSYDIILHHTAAPDFARFRVFLDGQALADVDGYAATVSPRTQALGRRAVPQGSHELAITVIGRAAASTGFAVGLDRLELRPVDGAPGPRADMGSPRRPSAPRPESPVAPVKPDLLARSVCIASPETCCPSGGVDAGCRMVTEALLEVRLRSYVPPRFTVMGRHDPWDVSFHLANIVSDVTVNGPFKVWPGCRFNVTEANNTIEESKTLLEKAGALAEAWLAQWSGGVETAKTFVAMGVADGVCSVVNDTPDCREKLAPLVKTGINLGLASLGIPPEIPDIQQLRQHGIRYLAATAASYALGDPELLKELPIDEKTRAMLFEQAYKKAFDIASTQLNKVLPPTTFKTDNPTTWGHLEPAYAPHHAHAYIDVRIRPESYATYLRFISKVPTHKWAPLYLHDLKKVYASVGPVAVPTFIPIDGIILPIELEPRDSAQSPADTAAAQIPGAKISRAWLEAKFGISAADGLVRAQYNYKPRMNASYGSSDWDLFYETTREARFRLLMPIGQGVLDWEKDWVAKVGLPRDRDTGVGVVSNGQIKPYYGRIDPAPRCDGKPPVIYSK